MFAFTLLLALLGGLLFFLFKTVQVIVSKKGSASVDYIEIERDNFVPFSTTKIRHALRTLFEDFSPERQKLLEKFFDKIENAFDIQYASLNTKLQNDFEILDPMRNQSDFSHLTSQQIQETEDHFLQNWELALQKANFKPLSQDRLEFATEEDYLNTLPIECGWDRLDSKLLTRYSNKYKKDNTDGKLNEHANQIWIYHRGVGVDRTEDKFLLQKLDLVVVKILNAVWTVLVKPFLPRSSTSSSSSSSSRNQSVDESKVVRRQTLKGDLAKYGLGSLFRQTTLQEPTFKDIVILYRLGKPSNQTSETLRQMVVENAQTVKNEHGIFIKSFRDVPMADLELIFPERTTYMKPLDSLKFCLAGIVGVVSAMVQIGLEPSIYVTMSTFGLFVGMLIKFFYDYQSWMLYYENSLNRILYDKNMDNHGGVILYLVEQLKYQEWKETVIAYAFLLRESAMSENELDEVCEKFLRDLSAKGGEKCDVDFECNDALAKLLKFGLVTESNGVYRPIPLENAAATLQRYWQTQDL